MSLKFGWVAREVRESIWREDAALGDIPAAAMDAWREDGDASHLRDYCTKGQPQIITYRNLTPDEIRVARSPWLDPSNVVEGYARVLLLCFRMGVDFVGTETLNDPDGTGAKFSIIVKDRGIRMLAEPFVTQLERDYPGMVAFYGALIWNGSTLTEPEKKASSPPSTPTPFSAEASTAATTAPSPSAAGA